MNNIYFFATEPEEHYSPTLLLSNSIRIPIAAKFLYGCLYDKMSEGNVDEFGRRFIICDEKEMCRELREPSKALLDYLITLEAADLIEHIGNDTYYIKKPVIV